jgi:hypothetical protein
MRGLIRQRWITGMIVILWVLLGPIGMAFSACAVMAGCEGACTLTSCLTPSLPMAALFPIGSVAVPLLEYPLMTVLKVPEPPPRSLPTSA